MPNPGVSGAELNPLRLLTQVPQYKSPACHPPPHPPKSSELLILAPLITVVFSA